MPSLTIWHFLFAIIYTIMLRNDFCTFKKRDKQTKRKGLVTHLYLMTADVEPTFEL